MNNLDLDKLREYFNTTPREKIEEDWAKTAEFDNVGPTYEDFHKLSICAQSTEKINYGIDYDELLRKFGPEGLYEISDNLRRVANEDIASAIEQSIKEKGV